MALFSLCYNWRGNVCKAGMRTPFSPLRCCILRERRRRHGNVTLSRMLYISRYVDDCNIRMIQAQVSFYQKRIYRFVCGRWTNVIKPYPGRYTVQYSTYM